MRRNSVLMLCLLWAALACAQQQQLPESQQLSPEKQQLSPEEQQLSPEQTGGVYYAYPVTEAEKAVFPDGFAVFYIEIFSTIVCWYIIITVTCQTAEFCVFVKRVTATCVRY